MSSPAEVWYRVIIEDEELGVSAFDAARTVVRSLGIVVGVRCLVYGPDGDEHTVDILPTD